MKKYTYSARKTDKSDKWWVVDAEGLVLGRLASQIASCLRGKHNPLYTPHVDTGDSVIVINADKVKLTGRKLDQKYYHYHSGYVGGLKSFTAKEMLQRKPEELIRHAVRGMLPKNRLGRAMMKKLRIYTGNDYSKHIAQKPEVMKITQ